MSLKQLGKEIGVMINCQHEDIFNMMHQDLKVRGIRND